MTTAELLMIGASKIYFTPPAIWLEIIKLRLEDAKERLEAVLIDPPLAARKKRRARKRKKK